MWNVGRRTRENEYIEKQNKGSKEHQRFTETEFGEINRWLYGGVIQWGGNGNSDSGKQRARVPRCCKRTTSDRGRRKDWQDYI